MISQLSDNLSRVGNYRENDGESLSWSQIRQYLRNRFLLTVICCLLYHWLEVSRGVGGLVRGAGLTFSAGASCWFGLIVGQGPITPAVGSGGVGGCVDIFLTSIFLFSSSLSGRRPDIN